MLFFFCSSRESWANTTRIKKRRKGNEERERKKDRIRTNTTNLHWKRRRKRARLVGSGKPMRADHSITFTSDYKANPSALWQVGAVPRWKRDLVDERALSRRTSELTLSPTIRGTRYERESEPSPLYSGTLGRSGWIEKKNSIIIIPNWYVAVRLDSIACLPLGSTYNFIFKRNERSPKATLLKITKKRTTGYNCTFEIKKRS